MGGRFEREGISVYLWLLLAEEWPGASMRNSARGKGHEEGGFSIHKGGIEPQETPVPKHLPPKPESVLCSHLYL